MRKEMRNILIVLSIIISINTYSQDPHFTQFYAAPLYLSPALAGGTAGTRAIINFRDQWPAIPGSFITYSLSLDHYFPKYNSGIGFFVFRDQAGSGQLGTTNIALQYAYNARINRKWSIRPGLQLYYSQRSIDFSKLIFNDQMQLGHQTSAASTEIPPDKSVGYMDFAFSMVTFSSKSWFGFTVDHINTPNQSLLDGNSKVPTKFIFFGGYKHVVDGKSGSFTEESINFVYNYRAQGKFDQIDLGVYWMKMQIIVGIWYRGIEGLKSYKSGYHNNDMIALLAGYQYKDMKFAYSYDFTISRLIGRTAGSHEISLIYEFNQDQKVRRRHKIVVVPCPKF
jgi:type IX secretion system PorP/SprF family membrane protein